MKRAPYFVLEGGDATGKSHHAPQLAEWLREAGHRVLHLREPGSTATGEALRRLLLDPDVVISPLTEALLFSAARAEMLRSEVRPALAAGTLVLVERCYLSTLVYQGVAADAGLSVELLRDVTAAVHGDLWPDRIFLLDVDEATRQQRAAVAGKTDRFEMRDSEFHRAVRRAYLELSDSDPRVERIDATPGLAHVQTALRRAVTASIEEGAT